MVETLSKGKNLVVILVSSLLAMSVALFITSRLLASVLYVISATLLVAFLTIYVTWSKKTIGIQKGYFHQLEQSIKRVEQQQKLHSAFIDEQTEVTERADQVDFKSSIIHSSREDSVSLYGLGSLPSAKVIKSNLTGVVGRRAAFIETETPKVSNLDIILNSDASYWNKRVGTILHRDSHLKLSKKHDTVALRPNQVASAVEDRFDYIVIDERASRHGLWAGFLETFRLGTFLDLASALRAAREKGAVVVLIEDPVASSLTSSIREIADIKLNLNSPQESDKFESLELYRDVREIVIPEEQTNV